MKRVTIAAILSILASQASASDFYIDFTTIGYGEANIKDSIAFSAEDSDTQYYPLELGIGYEITDNLLVEASFHRPLNVAFLGFGLADTYDLYEYRAVVGWRFNPEGNICVEPRMGISNWHLEGDESPTGNPGPEETFSESDTELFFQVGANFWCNRNFNLVLRYTHANYDFGDLNMGTLGVRFGF